MLRAGVFIALMLSAICCRKAEPTRPAPVGEFELVWRDDFAELSSARWSVADWTFDRNLCEFTPAQVSVKEGVLRLGIANKPYWGAEVFTRERYRYGKFEIDIKPVCPPGVVASFFLMHNQTDWEGRSVDWYEIDIEFPGSTREVSYALHYGQNGGIRSTAQSVELDFDAGDDFHRHTIIWKPDSIAFAIDGRRTAVFTDPAVTAELAEAMSIHMNYWISESEGWVGRFNPAVLPIQTAYRSAAYYRYRPMIE